MDPDNLRGFTDKFIYRLVNRIPEHRQTYLNIATAILYRDPSFCDKVAPRIFEAVISSQSTKGKEWEFLGDP